MLTGHHELMHSMLAFLAVAAVVTVTPGPAFALMLQVAAVHGRRAALANISGNSVGVLIWGLLSAVGVSALVAADQLAYDMLHAAGAAYLIYLGVRALLTKRDEQPAIAVTDLLRPDNATCAVWSAARKGLVNSLANPKLAVFFVALFPQFLTPGAAVAPAALAMAAVIVAFDFIWYGSVAMLVGGVHQVLRPRLLRRLERLSGAVLLAFGLRLAAETR